MRMVRLACSVLLLATALGGCTPRAEPGAAPQATETAAPITVAPTPAPAAPAAPAVQAPATIGTVADTTPASPAPTAAPADDLLPCTADDDCAVKDVGSCCGARPACVRADAKTFPEQVKARCAAEGRMSTCGFTAIEGCVCQSGRCAPVVASPGPASAQPVQ